jgi:chemotaxis response regulator CheB
MKILIADDHGIVRGGMRLLIDRQPDMEVVAEAEDGVDAFEQALQCRPDLCVLDVSMPRMTGLQAAREIRSHMPATQVLVLSMHDDERYVFDALKAGASGYVLKRGGGFYLDDGPGDNPPPDIEAIADAVPKSEPLNRFANNPYSVLGRDYVPQREVQPFRQRGIASWYGRRLTAGRPTWNGPAARDFAVCG